MPPIPTGPNVSDPSRWGAAARYDFDNPAKWVTVPGVPLLDEHEMTDEDGEPVGYVGPDALREIASNNNARVVNTGDPATLILGHTSDDPQAPEKPAEGFVVNYRVQPFKRDPRTGRTLYAVFGDYKLRPHKADLPERYPRRSVELWWNKKEIDPIAMLGGTTPERDLGVVIRKARLNSIRLETGGGDDEPIRFGRRKGGVFELYKLNRDCGGTMPPIPKPKRYSHDDMDDDERETFDRGYEDDDADTGDDDGYDDPDIDGGDAEDPEVAKIFQSRQWTEMSAKLDMVMQALEQLAAPPEPEGVGQEGMDQGMPQDGQPAGPQQGPPDDDAGYDDGIGAGGAEPDDQEDRQDHGDNPVRFESTGMPGPGNTAVPQFGGKGKKPMTTHYNRGGNMNRRSTAGAAQNPELIRLSRQNEQIANENRAIKLKLARSEAEKIVGQLEGEGILFGRTPQEHARGKAEEVEYLSLLDDEDRNFQVNVIRTRYARRATDPASPAIPGAARYARPAERGEPGDSVDEPSSPEEASMLADLEVSGMNRAEALKYMRNRRTM